MLLREVVPGIDLGLDYVVRIAFWPNAGVESGRRDGILPDPSQDTPLVGNGRGVVARVGVRRGGLRVVVVQIDKLETLRRQVDTCGQQIPGGGDPIDLGEGIESRGLLLIERKRKRENRRLPHFIIETLGEVELPGKNRPFHIEAGSRRTQAAHVPTANIELRQRIVQFPFPFLSPTLRIHRDDSRGETAILREIRSLEVIDAFHDIDRDGQSELAGSRVGYIGGIDEHRIAMLARSGELQCASGLPDDSRNQGQRIRHGCRAAGNGLDRVRADTGTGRGGGSGNGRCLGVHFDALFGSRGHERHFQRSGSGLVPCEIRHGGSLEARFRNSNGVPPGLPRREHRAPALVAEDSRYRLVPERNFDFRARHRQA